MGRKKRSKGVRPPRRRKKGVMTSMRSGFKSAVRGSGRPSSKRARLIGNIVTGVLAVVAGLLIARRCGVIRF